MQSRLKTQVKPEAILGLKTTNLLVVEIGQSLELRDLQPVGAPAPAQHGRQQRRHRHGGVALHRKPMSDQALFRGALRALPPMEGVGRQDAQHRHDFGQKTFTARWCARRQRRRLFHGAEGF